MRQAPSCSPRELGLRQDRRSALRNPTPLGGRARAICRVTAPPPGPRAGLGEGPAISALRIKLAAESSHFRGEVGDLRLGALRCPAACTSATFSTNQNASDKDVPAHTIVAGVPAKAIRATGCVAAPRPDRTYSRRTWPHWAVKTGA